MIDRKVTRYFDDRFIEFNALVSEIPCDDMPMNNVGGRRQECITILLITKMLVLQGLRA